MQSRAAECRLGVLGSGNVALNLSTVSSFSPKKYSTPAIPNTGSKTNWNRSMLVPENTPAMLKTASTTTRVIDAVFSPVTEDDCTPPPKIDSPLDEIRQKRALSTHSGNLTYSKSFATPFERTPGNVPVVNNSKSLKSGVNKENLSLLATASKLLNDDVTMRSKAFSGEQRTNQFNAKISKSCSDRFVQTDDMLCTYCSRTIKRRSSNYSDSLEEHLPTNEKTDDILRRDCVRPIIEECFEDLGDGFKRHFNGFFSQVLRRFDAQSEEMGLLVNQKAFIERLTQENEQLRTKVATLEALRYGK